MNDMNDGPAWGLNPRSLDYKVNALPTELSGLAFRSCNDFHKSDKTYNFLGPSNSGILHKTKISKLWIIIWQDIFNIWWNSHAICAKHFQNWLQEWSFQQWLISAHWTDFSKLIWYLVQFWKLNQCASPLPISSYYNYIHKTYTSASIDWNSTVLIWPLWTLVSPLFPVLPQGYLKGDIQAQIVWQYCKQMMWFS